MAKRVAEFLKVSFEQFAEGYRDSFGECDEKLIREVYDSLKLPRRATRGSAGYDFFGAEVLSEKRTRIQIPPSAK